MNTCSGCTKQFEPIITDQSLPETICPRCRAEIRYWEYVGKMPSLTSSLLRYISKPDNTFTGDPPEETKDGGFYV